MDYTQKENQGSANESFLKKVQYSFERSNLYGQIQANADEPSRSALKALIPFRNKKPTTSPGVMISRCTRMFYIQITKHRINTERKKVQQKKIIQC